MTTIRGARSVAPGVGLLAASTVARIALPTSYNPENAWQVLATYLAEIALWLGLLCLLAFAVGAVVSGRDGDGDDPTSVAAQALRQHPVACGVSLLAFSALVRVVSTDAPGPVSRLHLLASQVEWISLWLGMICVAAYLAGSLVREPA